MRYLKTFGNHNNYEDFTETEAFVKPNVSYCIQQNEVHYNPIKSWKDEYLRTTALTDGTIAFHFTGYIDSTAFSSISYSIDNGNTWITIENDGENDGVEVPVTAGDSILWKGNGTYMSHFERGDGYYSCGFGSSEECQFDVDGNIMSLLYGDNFANQTTLTSNLAFGGTFAKSNVVSAENLILPATTLTQSCYATMFWQCTNLINAPELPATTLASNCYSDMFNGCSNLNSITCLATDISASYCTSNWVTGVAASGTFTKAASMSSWTTGVDGIPTNWTVQDATE